MFSCLKRSNKIYLRYFCMLICWANLVHFGRIYIRERSNKTRNIVTNKDGNNNYDTANVADNKNGNMNSDNNSDEVLTILRPSEVTLRNKFWQVISDGSTLDKRKRKEVVVYSAFYDVRGGSAYVRVLAVRRKLGRDLALFCQLWFGADDNEVPLVVEAAVERTGREHVMTSWLTYKQELLSCRLSADLDRAPLFVSITFAAVQNSTIYLPVQRMNNPGRMDGRVVDEYEYEFVVCVTQAYGELDAYEIAEWVEALRLMGVGKIGIYNGSIVPSRRLDRVLDYYIKDGILDLRQLNTPAVEYEEERKITAFKLSSPASLNDCMMRHAMRARWVVVVDFDELILPTKSPDYQSLMHILFSREREQMLAKEVKRLKLKESNSSFDSLVTGLKVEVERTWTPRNSYLFRMTYFFRFFEEDSHARELMINEREQLQTTAFQQVGPTKHEPGNQSENFQQSIPTKQTTTQHRYKLFTDKYKLRTAVQASYNAPKAFINPRSCLSLFNHYCYIEMNKKDPRRQIVDDKLAKVHHYRRKCSGGRKQCQKLNSTRTRDLTANKFSSKLHKKLKTVFNEIFS